MSNLEDCQQFGEILAEALEKFGARLLAYCIMPNHWHLVLLRWTQCQASKPSEKSQAVAAVEFVA